jgi:hypothetical protein
MALCRRRGREAEQAAEYLEDLGEALLERC